ncbi:MAG: hypothetical protein EPN23_02180 [Verrucomicrobia bacterium]|nr:MAG: hypothetical protein EPN23_02180 [Verrucomicrobiota bacterium]
MKLRFVFAMLGAMLAGAANAQVEIFCQPIHTDFLISEETTIRVEVHNNTSDTLVLAGTNRNAKLGFELTTESGAAVSQRTELPFAPADVIHSGETWTRAIDLLPFYDLRNPGRLMLRTYIEWDGKAFLTPKHFFNLTRGPEMGKLIVAAGTGQKKATVKYSLRTVARAEGEMLFLCIEDPETQVRVAAANLGTSIRLYPPQLRRDAEARLHVLHQAAPNRFTHSVLTDTGHLLNQEHFATDYQMPEMREVDAHVVVTGRPYIPGDDRRLPLGPETNH